MSASIDDVLEERGSYHGEFRHVSKAYDAMTEAFYDNAPLFDHRYSAAVDMIIMKLARIACGDPTYEDHWIDISGYAELGRRLNV